MRANNGIRLYYRGKENGVNILKSIDEGPFQMGTTRVIVAEGTEGSLNLGPERPRVYSDLLQDEKDRFAKLINDMRNIKMTMSKIQLNSKFVNNMLPEWGRFVTAVKLNKGLKDSNFDQLYAYLKQQMHYDNENKMMLERLTQQTVDLLNLDVQDGRVVVQNVQGRQNRGHGNNARGTGAAGYGGAQNRVGNANPGQARQVKCYNCNGVGHIARNCTQPKRPQNFEYFKDKMLLMQAQENRVVLDEEQLLFLAGGQDNAIDEDVDEQPVQDLALNVDNIFQVDDCDAYDSDVGEAPMAQTMFLANLSSADLVYDEAGLSYDSDTSNLRLRSKTNDHSFRMLFVYTSRRTGMRTLCTIMLILLAHIADYTRNNREVHLHYLRHLKESVDTLREIVEEAKVERPVDRSLASACRYTKHSQELLEYVFGTCPKVFNQQDKKHAHTLRKKQVTFEDQIATSSRVNSCTDASGSQPRSILKKHQIPPAKSDSMKKVEEHPRTIRSSLKTTNRVDSSNSSKRPTGRTFTLGDQCPLTRLTKPTGMSAIALLLNRTHPNIGDPLSKSPSFVCLVKSAVRFGNDHFGAIMGYGDYVVGDSVISRVYYMEGLSRICLCFTLWLKSGGVEYCLGCSCKKHGVVINDEVLPNLLAIQSLQAQIMVMAIMRVNSTPDKTPYELVHNKKHDLTFFWVFGALCYLQIDSEKLGKLQQGLILEISLGYAPSRKVTDLTTNETGTNHGNYSRSFEERTEPIGSVQSSPGRS
ncbi:retrovirus-related pol polyprotein from transposon TNT 1-94 [Tanacetum coccineum]